MEEKIELMLWRAAVAAGFVVLTASIVGMGSCASYQRNADQACMIAGGRRAKIEETSGEGSNRQGCYKINATLEPVSIEAFR